MGDLLAVEIHDADVLSGVDKVPAREFSELGHICAGLIGQNRHLVMGLVGEWL